MTTNLTDRRRAWLVHVRDHAPAHRDSTNVGCACMRAGWTRWVYVNKQGEEMTDLEAKDRYGDRWWDIVRISGERLTDAGRKMLEAG